MVGEDWGLVGDAALSSVRLLANFRLLFFLKYASKRAAGAFGRNNGLRAVSREDEGHCERLSQRLTIKSLPYLFL